METTMKCSFFAYTLSQWRCRVKQVIGNTKVQHLTPQLACTPHTTLCHSLSALTSKRALPTGRPGCHHCKPATDSNSQSQRTTADVTPNTHPCLVSKNAAQKYEPGLQRQPCHDPTQHRSLLQLVNASFRDRPLEAARYCACADCT